MRDFQTKPRIFYTLSVSVAASLLTALAFTALSVAADTWELRYLGPLAMSLLTLLFCSPVWLVTVSITVAAGRLILPHQLHRRVRVWCIWCAGCAAIMAYALMLLPPVGPAGEDGVLYALGQLTLHMIEPIFRHQTTTNPAAMISAGLMIGAIGGLSGFGLFVKRKESFN